MTDLDEPWQSMSHKELGMQANNLLLFELSQPAVVRLSGQRGEMSEFALEAGVWLLAVSGKHTVAIEPGAAYQWVPATNLCSLLAFVDAAGAVGACKERQAGADSGAEDRRGFA